MKRIKKYLLIIVIIAVCAVLLWGGRRKEEQETISEFRYQADKPRVVSYYQGEKRWDLAAESILEPKSDKKKKEKIILLNVKDGKLYRGDKLEYQLDADKIIYFTDSEDVELTGNVKLKEVQGKEILTSKLEWLAKEDKLITDSGVKVKLEDGELSSQKMEIDVENKTIDFIGKVEMTFEIKGVESNEK